MHRLRQALWVLLIAKEHLSRLWSSLAKFVNSGKVNQSSVLKHGCIFFLDSALLQFILNYFTIMISIRIKQVFWRLNFFYSIGSWSILAFLKLKGLSVSYDAGHQFSSLFTDLSVTCHASTIPIKICISKKVTNSFSLCKQTKKMQNDCYLKDNTPHKFLL